jgi:hypothetical protein
MFATTIYPALTGDRMCMEARELPTEKLFHGSMEQYLDLRRELQTPRVLRMQLSSLESLVEVRGREILRTMLEEHIELRGPGNIGEAVLGSDGVSRTHLRERAITIKTIFGEVEVERTVYSKPGATSLAPKEAMLNLPERSYSHALRQRVAKEAVKGSFDEATLAIRQQTGVLVPKRQAEEIVVSAARDFEAFYEEREKDALRRVTKANEILVLTTDGKGVTMLKEGLREATRKRAEETVHKLETRLSKGEKSNAKRMAQVASVYSIDRHERTAADILDRQQTEAPKPEGKRVWASLVRDQKSVIGDMLDEAQRRDPRQCRPWAVLVDGQTHQLGLITTALDARELKATIVLDLVHVIEYLWKASRDFHGEGTPAGEAWVKYYLAMVLAGKAALAAAGMRRSATRQGLDSRDGVDKCADYLHANAAYMAYDAYLAAGLPIATGVIEGACRHLVKDRMDLTGARWSLNGAEAVLRLRSLHASGDWDEYWRYHEAAEYERNHRSRYAKPVRLEQPRLRRVK